MRGRVRCPARRRPAPRRGRARPRGARRPRAPRRRRRRPHHRRRRRGAAEPPARLPPHPRARVRPAPRPAPRPGPRRGRERLLLPQPGPLGRSGAGPRAGRARRRPATARLARGPARPRRLRAHRARRGTRVPPAARRRRRRRRRPGRLRAADLRRPPDRRAGVGLRALDPELLLAHDRLQGHAHRPPALALLRRPARPRAAEPGGGRPLAFLHQHVPELGARPAAAAARPQRRDQHPRRQRQLDAGARGRAALEPVRRRPPSAACR